MPLPPRPHSLEPTHTELYEMVERNFEEIGRRLDIIERKIR